MNLTRQLLGTDVRFFLDDQPLPKGDLSDWEYDFLYGDGTDCPPLGIFASNLAPGQRSTMPTPLPPGTMTRQRRRAAARAAAKRRD